MSSERGSATLIVLALLGLIAMLLMANGAAVHRLHQELRRIENSQRQHWQPGEHGKDQRH